MPSSSESSPVFRLSLAGKDARLVQESAAAHGLDLPLFETIRERIEAGAREHGDQDMSATWFESAPAQRHVRNPSPAGAHPGGGYVGMNAALELERCLAPDEADLELVAPENFMLYQPLLPEVASGALEPRHGVVPLRRVLRRTSVTVGRVTGVDADRRTAIIEPTTGDVRETAYDELVSASARSPGRSRSPVSWSTPSTFRPSLRQCTCTTRSCPGWRSPSRRRGRMCGAGRSRSCSSAVGPESLRATNQAHANAVLAQ